MGVRFPLPAPIESMSYRDKRIFGCVFLCPNYGQAGIRFVPEHRGEIGCARRTPHEIEADHHGLKGQNYRG